MNTLSVADEHLTSYLTLELPLISYLEKYVRELYCTYIVFSFFLLIDLALPLCGAHIPPSPNPLGYDYIPLIREP